MQASYLLLADVDDVLKVVATIVFVVLSGLGQLLASRDKGKKVKPKVRGANPGNRPRAPGAGPAGPQQDALRREVEDFLRKARGDGDRPQPVAQQRPGQPRPIRGGSAGAGRGGDTAPRSRPPLREPAASASPPELQHPRESVAQHVKTHLGSHPVTEHSSHLAETIGLADERMEEHLRAKFSHKLGSLDQSAEPAVQVAVSSPVVAELMATLTRPGGARQLILANEILRRPEERWTHGS